MHSLIRTKVKSDIVIKISSTLELDVLACHSSTINYEFVSASRVDYIRSSTQDVSLASTYKLS